MANVRRNNLEIFPSYLCFLTDLLEYKMDATEFFHSFLRSLIQFLVFTKEKYEFIKLKNIFT